MQTNCQPVSHSKNSFHAAYRRKTECASPIAKIGLLPHLRTKNYLPTDQKSAYKETMRHIFAIFAGQYNTGLYIRHTQQ